MHQFWAWQALVYCKTLLILIKIQPAHTWRAPSLSLIYCFECLWEILKWGPDYLRVTMNCFVTPNNTLLNTAQLVYRQGLADEILLLIAIYLFDSDTEASCWVCLLECLVIANWKLCNLLRRFNSQVDVLLIEKSYVLVVLHAHLVDLFARAILMKIFLRSNSVIQQYWAKMTKLQKSMCRWFYFCCPQKICWVNSLRLSSNNSMPFN